MCGAWCLAPSYNNGTKNTVQDVGRMFLEFDIFHKTVRGFSGSGSQLKPTVSSHNKFPLSKVVYQSVGNL